MGRRRVTFGPTAAKSFRCCSGSRLNSAVGGSSNITQRDKVEGRDDDEWRQRVLCQCQL